MLDNLKKKNNLKKIGIVVVGGLVISLWWFGWFPLVFYILGLYAAVYIVSYLFKTTSVISFLLGVGGFFLYAISTIVGLYVVYIVLSLMFTGNFWWGLLFLILLSVFGPILYLIPMAVGLVLGYPLMFMSEDIEKRFHTPDPQTLFNDVTGKS